MPGIPGTRPIPIAPKKHTSRLSFFCSFASSSFHPSILLVSCLAMPVFSRPASVENASLDDGAFSPRTESRLTRSPSVSGHDIDDDALSDAASEYHAPSHRVSRRTDPYRYSQDTRIHEDHHSRSRISVASDRRSRVHFSILPENRHSRSHNTIHSDDHRPRSHIPIYSDSIDPIQDELIRLREEVRRLHTERQQLKRLTELAYVILSNLLHYSKYSLTCHQRRTRQNPQWDPQRSRDNKRRSPEDS